LSKNFLAQHRLSQLPTGCHCTSSQSKANFFYSAPLQQTLILGGQDSLSINKPAITASKEDNNREQKYTTQPQNFPNQKHLQKQPEKYK